jgi:hypothetical protein
MPNEKLEDAKDALKRYLASPSMLGLGEVRGYVKKHGVRIADLGITPAFYRHGLTLRFDLRHPKILNDCHRADLLKRLNLIRDGVLKIEDVGITQEEYETLRALVD